MEEPNNDIDTETLQAQIDLSMAYAQNLIASWLPGSMTSTQSQSQASSSSLRAAEAEAELQAFLRRPPRLGVGAPLPETSAPAQTRLVQKLEGDVKKRRRAQEMENGALPVNGGGDDGDDDDELEEEESRVGAIRKRRRGMIEDPFESGGNKKKKKKKTMGGGVEEQQQQKVSAKDEEEEEEEAPQTGMGTGMMATVNAMMSPGPRKKKKKKRKSLPGAQGQDVVLGGPVGEVGSANRGADIVQHAEHSMHLWKHRERSTSGSPSSSVVSPTVGAPQSKVVSPKPPPKSPSKIPVQQPPTASSIPSALLPAFSPPILNLTGAVPPTAPEKMEGSGLKKRRRKKKKKKPTGDQGAVNKDVP